MSPSPTASPHGSPGKPRTNGAGTPARTGDRTATATPSGGPPRMPRRSCSPSADRSEDVMSDGKHRAGREDSNGPGPAPAGPAFRQDLRGAVTPRAVILLLGVLILEMAFVVSFIGAFHSPRPRNLPLAVVAPGQAQARLVAELNSLPGEPLDARAADSASEARAMVLDRRVDAALLAGPGGGPDRLLVATAGGPAAVQSLQAVFAKTGGGSVVVDDLRPPSPSDGRALAGFYLVLGVVVGGYLASAALSASYGARPASPNRTSVRLLALPMGPAAAAPVPAPAGPGGARAAAAEDFQQVTLAKGVAEMGGTHDTGRPAGPLGAPHLARRHTATDRRVRHHHRGGHTGRLQPRRGRPAGRRRRPRLLRQPLRLPLLRPPVDHPGR